MKESLPVSSEAKICTVICVILSALYFFGMAPLAYGYYTFLRIVSLVGLLIFIFQYFVLCDQFINPVNIIVGIILILFNPIAPIYLTKSIWVVLDFVCGIIMLILAVYIWIKHRHTKV